jgi:hypothetical protein
MQGLTRDTWSRVQRCEDDGKYPILQKMTGLVLQKSFVANLTKHSPAFFA